MSPPVPIALFVDDPTPLVHLYRHHIYDLKGQHVLDPARQELVRTVPNSFLERFCEVVQRHNMAGKFSIVPAPAGQGDVVRGIEGYGFDLVRSWIQLAVQRLSRFDFCPEMLTHSWAIDLRTGRPLDENENDWSEHQDRETLTPYIAHALSLLKQAGVDATGVTSPWTFGARVEVEYAAAIALAQSQVYGRWLTWYFLHIADSPAECRPRVMARESGCTVVHIPVCADDLFWDALWRYPRVDAAVRDELADRMLTKDGRRGVIRETLDGGGWPVLLSHWPSLFCNGREGGLSVLDEIGRRVSAALGDSVCWTSALEMAECALST
jgi:hypothetical protein